MNNGCEKVLNSISIHRTLQRKHQPGEREKATSCSLTKFKVGTLLLLINLNLVFFFFIEGFDFILQGALLKNEVLMAHKVLDYRLVRKRSATIEQTINVIRPSNLRNKSETSFLT